MANPNGRKGSGWEIDARDWLRTKKNIIVERLARAGSKDEGDLMCVIAGKTYILELKNVKSVTLPQFWREAQVEAKNYADARGLEEVPLHYIVVKRRNHSVDKAWVIQDFEQWVKEKTGDAKN